MVSKFISAVCVAAACINTAAAEECTPQNLAGTWRLVSAQADGRPLPRDAKTTHLLFMTPTHFMSVDYDASGAITDAFGGSHTISKSVLRSMIEFRVGDKLDKAPMHQELANACALDGDRWTSTGDFRSTGGPLLESVYERVKPSTTPPPNKR